MPRPCPWCGGTNLRYERYGNTAWLQCLTCKCLGPEALVNIYDQSDEEMRTTAERAWDLRHIEVFATGPAP